MRSLASRVPLFSLVILFLFAGAFWIRAGRARTPSVTSAAPSCDSTTAARIAIDSLAQIDPFRSKVLRFARNSGSVRIVTMPDGQVPVLDGMAVVWINARCRIISLMQTDSA
jgi:hypothetical protein